MIQLNAHPLRSLQGWDYTNVNSFAFLISSIQSQNPHPVAKNAARMGHPRVHCKEISAADLRGVRANIH